MYDWGYHSSDEQYAHVSVVHDGGRTEDVFDVTLYDPECIDPETGLNGMEQSRNALQALIALANVGLKALNTVTKLQDEAEVARARTLLFVAWDRVEREDGSKLVTEDPYTLDDETVLKLWNEIGGEAQTLIFEHGDYMKGEDYETLDNIEGSEQVLGQIYTAITQV